MKYRYDGNLNATENKHNKNGISYYVRGTVTVAGRTYERYAIQTHFVARGEDYIELIKHYVSELYQEGDLLSISEKVVSMCQDNVVTKSEVKLSWAARFLSRFGKKTDSGIGITEPYKLQLMIDMKGLPRVLWAGLAGAVGKLFRHPGVFYEILGNDAAGIDGFYAHSAFDDYHDMAVLLPREPEKVCDDIWWSCNIPAVVVDANDIDVTILGKSDILGSYPDEFLRSLILDNPAGQDDECTPFILIRDITGKAPQPYMPPKALAVN